MGAPSNLSATRRMIRELRAGERLAIDTIALQQLAITSASVLDDAIATGTAPYALGRLISAHRETVRSLTDAAVTYESDALDDLLRRATMPTPGTRGDDAGAPGSSHL